MAISGDFRPYVRTTIASLKNGLDAKIDAYNADPDAEFQLDKPDPASYYFGGDETALAFPKVEVAIPTGRMTNFAIEQVAADMDGDLIVAVWLEGETGEIPEMYEKNLGYAHVATEVLVAPGACGPSTRIEDIAYTFPAVPQGSYNETTRTFERWRVASLLELTISDH